MSSSAPVFMPRFGSSSSLTAPSAFSPGLENAAATVLARLRACRWNMADGCTGITRELPAREGEVLRSVPNSGAGPRREMEMLNWVGVAEGGARGAALAPVMRRVNGHWCSDHRASNTWGFWCKRPPAMDEGQPLARNRMPYNVSDPHFVVMALSVPGSGHGGVAFQASKAEEDHAAELALSNNRPQARWTDADGQRIVLTAPDTLAPHQPAVITICSRPGAQSLRVNGRIVAEGEGTLGRGTFSQMLIGWGFRSFFPNEGFGGYVYGAITGRGVPEPQELELLERYLGESAGILL
ncbi:hypothetical protein [Ramlibacter rhizophilus]|uniref:LamG domain-containing protein n=1 Tax=Ramlibacter rhizophilus TaxID=1781167 RepID=A0A4Z0BC46_9BURK|nr:hypothetical protein [Ramlibacter rhizophilus]TFY96782.1 hypothetical protein EZ242_19040 [Ramlibacter rhizophilus]